MKLSSQEEYGLRCLLQVARAGEVLAALGGRFYDTGFCDRHSGVATCCTHLPDCSIRPVLRQLQTVVDQVLGALTLKSLLCTEHEVTWGSPRAVPLPLAIRIRPFAARAGGSRKAHGRSDRGGPRRLS